MLDNLATKNHFKMKKILFVGFFTFGLFISIKAQTENCTDGIDNNNNGLIDCFDPVCACECEDLDYYYSEPILSSNECKVDCEFFNEADSFQLRNSFRLLSLQQINKEKTGIVPTRRGCEA